MLPWYPADADDPARALTGIGCRDACPVHTDAGRYARALARGDAEEAVRIARRRNPLVSACAHVCPAPCEAACARGALDRPLELRRLKLEAVRAVDPRTVAPEPTSHRGRGYRVAVVGAGPAGLAAAHDLACLGYEVTLLEARGSPGGIPEAAIPRFRLPREDLRRDVEGVLDLGVRLRTGAAVEGDRGARELLADGYAAVIVATGLGPGRRPALPGVELPGVMDGLDLLERAARREPLAVGGEVVVVGGGDTAVDVARVLRRLGPDGLVRSGPPDPGAGPRVTLCLRRRALSTRARRDGARAAEREGVRLLPRRIPRSVAGAGRVEALVVSRVAVERDPTGRYAPRARPGTRERLEADTVVLAVGRSPGDGVAPAAPPEADPRILRAGDLAGARSVIEAVADGQRQAARVDRLLTGGVERRRAPVSLRPVARRPGSEAAGHEGARCLDCWTAIHSRADRDAGRCLLCGTCVSACPGTALRLIPAPEPADGALLVIDDRRCLRCHLCVERCPAGCLRPVRREERAVHA